MKKLIVAMLLSMSLVALDTNVVLADQTDSQTHTIVISAPENSNSKTYRVYKKKGKKMVATKKKVAIANKKQIKHWYAKSVEVQGKNWWKIGKNRYFKDTRVEIVNVSRNEALGNKITNYANKKL